MASKNYINTNFCVVYFLRFGQKHDLHRNCSYEWNTQVTQLVQNSYQCERLPLKYTQTRIYWNQYTSNQTRTRVYANTPIVQLPSRPGVCLTKQSHKVSTDNAGSLKRIKAEIGKFLEHLLKGQTCFRKSNKVSMHKHWKQINFLSIFVCLFVCYGCGE